MYENKVKQFFVMEVFLQYHKNSDKHNKNMMCHMNFFKKIINNSCFFLSKTYITIRYKKK